MKHDSADMNQNTYKLHTIQNQSSLNECELRT